MKRSPIRRQSKNPLRVLRRKAWKVFADWIKARDNFRCFTCGAEGNQAGHFLHRDCLDFTEENIHCQCVRCNHFLNGNLAVYTIKMIKKYGLKKVEVLQRKANIPKSFNRQDLEEIIKKYGK